MRDTIINFAEQFKYKPVIENAGVFKKRKRLIVIGMGGSHLAGDILAAIKPSLGIIVHQNYGLPGLSEEDLNDSLFVLSSYSGDTEEVLDAYRMAKERNLPMAVISIGGKLLESAKKDGMPFVRLPDTGIAPRFALGFSFSALLKIAGEDEMLLDAEKLAAELVPESWEEQGKLMAKNLAGKVPLIYASLENQTLAYNWKVRLNETGRIPAFYNVFPELNHNELDGFDARESVRGLSENFYFIFLRDIDDDPRIIKRMEAMKTLLEEKNLPTEVVRLENGSALYKIFASVVLADWMSHYLAEGYGIKEADPHLVEKFKKLIGQ